MLKTPFPLSNFLSVIGCIALLAACDPTYNWREVRSADAPYTVNLPAKPASHSRPVNLNGIQVTMTMTAAEVEGVTFAVGSAKLSDPKTAAAALQSMKTAMTRNIGGTIRQEKSFSTQGSSVPSIELEVAGSPGANTGGQPKVLHARFIEKDQWIYQVIVLGSEPSISREAVDTFFSSFKIN
jgi:hypothetical protein